MIRATLGFAVRLLAAPLGAQTCICPKCAFGDFRNISPISGRMMPSLEPDHDTIFDLTVMPRDSLGRGLGLAPFAQIIGVLDPVR